MCAFIKNLIIFKINYFGFKIQGKPIYAFHLGKGITTKNIQNRTSLLLKNTKLKKSISLKQGILEDESDFFDFIQAKTIKFIDHRLSKAVLIGNLHGHDHLSPQLLVHFISFICENRGHLNEISDLLDHIRITIVPVPNPDGFFKSWFVVNRNQLVVNHLDSTKLLNTPDCYTWKK